MIACLRRPLPSICVHVGRLSGYCRLTVGLHVSAFGPRAFAGETGSRETGMRDANSILRLIAQRRYTDRLRAMHAPSPRVHETLPASAAKCGAPTDVTTDDELGLSGLHGRFDLMDPAPSLDPRP